MLTSRCMNHGRRNHESRGVVSCGIKRNCRAFSPIARLVLSSSCPCSLPAYTYLFSLSWLISAQLPLEVWYFPLPHRVLSSLALQTGLSIHLLVFVTTHAQSDSVPHKLQSCRVSGSLVTRNWKKMRGATKGTGCRHSSLFLSWIQDVPVI